ncbi:MAG TPA: flavin reductase family protein [Streptosporangiaceae bacterium]
MLGRFVTGVTVATACADDTFVGVTANSFTSVSLDPPLVLFCVHNDAHVCGPLQQAGAFAINILGADQAHVSRQFAGARVDRFAGVPVREGVTASPILRDALAYLECHIAGVMSGGDHLIILGAVCDLGVQRDDRPLTFYRGDYGRLA